MEELQKFKRCGLDTALGLHVFEEPSPIHTPTDFWILFSPHQPLLAPVFLMAAILTGST